LKLQCLLTNVCLIKIHRDFDVMVMIVIITICRLSVHIIAEHCLIVGRDSLRCLALATVDEPRKKDDMNLTDPTQFIHFEVC